MRMNVKQQPTQGLWHARVTQGCHHLGVFQQIKGFAEVYADHKTPK